MAAQRCGCCGRFAGHLEPTMVGPVLMPCCPTCAALHRGDWRELSGPVTAAPAPRRRRHLHVVPPA